MPTLDRTLHFHTSRTTAVRHTPTKATTCSTFSNGSSGILPPHEGLVRFAQDYEFDSPNRAAEVVCGGSVNARQAWLAEAGGQPLGRWAAG